MILMWLKNIEIKMWLVLISSNFKLRIFENFV